MSDQILIHNGKVVLTTEEGQKLERAETLLLDMLRREYLPPLNGTAFPDGVKFYEWRDPFLLLVHQTPPHVRQMRWIANDSPYRFGQGVKYRKVRLSIPYSLTFAMYCCQGTGMFLGHGNELYFRNEPLRFRNDKLCFPALLNLSRFKKPPPKRERAWVCTQYLRWPPDADWTKQLHCLLDHIWNGGFNLSSEDHEGASWFGESKNIHPSLQTVEKWEAASKANDAFALGVPWLPAPFTVGELINIMLDEHMQGLAFAAGKPQTKKKPNLVQRFLNFAQKNQG
jgi:hypothetical protein